MALDLPAEAARALITAVTALGASFFGAKWAESRKLQARLEKLDHIREEVREVTRVQEDIKRQLQGGEWNRQTLWRQRLEAYTRLLGATSDYLDRCFELQGLLQEGKAAAMEARSADLARLRADTFKAATVVEIFADDAVIEVLRGFFQRMSAPTAGSSGSMAALSHEIEVLGDLQKNFVAAARAQLKGTLDE